jgi:ArsR family transcriptional regulator
MTVTDQATGSPTGTADCATCCPPAQESDAAALQRAAEVFKALSDPVRLRLYARIAACEGQICVCDIQDVGVSQPTVSHHLRKLREAGLIDCERRGTWVYYWPIPGALGPAFQMLR